MTTDESGDAVFPEPTDADYDCRTCGALNGGQCRLRFWWLRRACPRSQQEARDAQQ